MDEIEAKVRAHYGLIPDGDDKEKEKTETASSTDETKEVDE